MLRVLSILIILLTLSCAQKATFREILGKDTVRARVELVRNPSHNLAIQKVALRNLKDKLLNPPPDVKLKLKVMKKEGKLQLTEGSNADLVISMELKKLRYEEKRYKTKEEDMDITYFCVERQATADVLFNVMNAKSKEVLFAKVYKGGFYKRYCDEKGYKSEKLPKPDFIKLKAIEDAEEAFVREFYSLL
ncbi:hypothetical protein [Aquifex aeolicus]|uniref:Uncharacterized protein aq_1277 n=1 Tax=Aquifex aeolicus (strain VF5) TaxID=224324 RepID=Y1277_AQUAE|nr:hypothetical protein [Aquifex aeolicus]O67313.1 RecName: Full=Uncharacterized protein aq_1277 [Aquifex aeolicus VF5]AAC07278.1 putative protein [Aquifex aeolicus VF5]